MYQRTNTQPMRTKIHSQIKIYLKNINKIEKYKKAEHEGAQNRHEYWQIQKLKNKTDMNITKYKNRSWKSTKQIWTLLNTKTDHDRPQNRY